MQASHSPPANTLSPIAMEPPVGATGHFDADGDFQVDLPPLESTFTVRIIASLLCNGKPESISTHYLPKTRTWEDVQESFTSMTLGWYATLGGHPNGYSLADGKWLYQLINDTWPLPELHDLTTADQFQIMRQKMEKDGLGLLVWHECIYKDMKEKKAFADAAPEGWVDFHNAAELDQSMFEDPIQVRNYQAGL